MDFHEHTATQAVQDSFRDTPDPRLRELLNALTRHLHDYVREVKPSVHEWEQAIRFLTAVGRACTDTRQEFALLSDVLGVSMLVETLNERGGGTESTVLGPFHMVESPPACARRQHRPGRRSGAMHRVGTRVLDTTGTPLPNAEVDVWQCNDQGFYDVQQPRVKPSGNGRGLFHTDAEGRFWFRTVLPSHYPIPTDGPIGRLLEATHRRPYRPAHIHFIVQPAGHAPLTTHVFVAGSPISTPTPCSPSDKALSSTSPTPTTTRPPLATVFNRLSDTHSSTCPLPEHQPETLDRTQPHSHLSTTCGQVVTWSTPSDASVADRIGLTARVRGWTTSN